MASKKKVNSTNKEEAIENLICAATRLCYPIRTCDWNSEFSLCETRLLSELREMLRELKKFHN